MHKLIFLVGHMNGTGFIEQRVGALKHTRAGLKRRNVTSRRSSTAFERQHVKSSAGGDELASKMLSTS